MKQFLIVCICMLSFSTYSQHMNNLPYKSLDKPTENVTAGTVMARFIDGLGFRFYWSTEGLRAEDYAYQISDKTRTTGETITHIHGLSELILASAKHKEVERLATDSLSIEEVRAQTLINLKEAADLFRVAENMNDFKIHFPGREMSLDYLMNGPINDATWHCGQIASFRRASGNPISDKISHFTGTVKE